MQTNYNMLKINNLIGGGKYASPSLEEIKISSQRVICVSNVGRSNPYTVSDEYEIGGDNTTIF